MYAKNNNNFFGINRNRQQQLQYDIHNKKKNTTSTTLFGSSSKHKNLYKQRNNKDWRFRFVAFIVLSFAAWCVVTINKHYYQGNDITPPKQQGKYFLLQKPTEHSRGEIRRQNPHHKNGSNNIESRRQRQKNQKQREVRSGNNNNEHGDENDDNEQQQQLRQQQRYQQNASFAVIKDQRHEEEDEEEPVRSVVREEEEEEGGQNKYREQQNIEKEEQGKVGEEYFLFRSGNKDCDDAYRLAIEEIKLNIDDTDGDGGWHFIAGAGWKQLWTRDTAYAIELGAGLLFPGVSKRSLMKCTEIPDETLQPRTAVGHRVARDARRRDETVWLQDTCGHFGGWPNLSDAIVGARGAWAYYLVSGDLDFLEWAYQITIRSLGRAEVSHLFDEATGLVKGCSSFMESNSGYPEEYKHEGELVGSTKALSTNLLYYSGYVLCIEFIMELLNNNNNNNDDKKRLDGSSSSSSRINPQTAEQQLVSLRKKADKLRNAIRTEMWLSDEGYYSYVKDATNKFFVQMEGLGESLALLIPGFETDPDRINSIFHSVETMIQQQNNQQHTIVNSSDTATNNNNKHYRYSAGGIPCLWPKFSDTGVTVHSAGANEEGLIAETYHNGNIWPFVQGYWAMAAARHGRLSTFNNELKKLIRLSQLRNTFAEYYEVETSTSQKVRRQVQEAEGNKHLMEYRSYNNHTAQGSSGGGGSGGSSNNNNDNKNDNDYYFSPYRRRRQLWSDTGLISMVFYGLFGMNFKPDGIYFQPVVPSPELMELNNNHHHDGNDKKTTGDRISLVNVPYRDMVLSVYIKGFGTVVRSFSLDRQELPEPFVPNNITGSHTVEIVLVDNISSSREEETPT